MSTVPHAVAVIGAGWAGLSCAHHLEQTGASVSVFEASSQIGGRARSAPIRLNGQSIKLDNGQHMLIGAYRETLDLIEQSHSKTQMAAMITRYPLQFESSDIHITRKGSGRLGLVWGIMTGRGVGNRARLALLRFGLAMARAKWQVAEQQTVSELLAQTRQPSTLVNAMWRPLCVAALNTEPELACAQTFVNVVHDSMFSSDDGSDFLVANEPLGNLLPEPMRKSLIERGVQWHSPSPVRALSFDKSETCWQVQTSKDTHRFDSIVLATPSATSAQLLSDTHLRASATLALLEPESIRTVYLAWQQPVTLPALRMLDESPAQNNYGQWIFDRGLQDGQQIAAVIVSAANGLSIDNNELAALVAKQLATQLDVPAPDDAKTVNEKTATFLCSPKRPNISAGNVGSYALPDSLALAGDYCYRRYPATLEAAVISGRLASDRLARCI